MTYKDELTIKLQKFGIEPTDYILRFIDLETIPLKAKIFDLSAALSKAEDKGEYYEGKYANILSITHEPTNSLDASYTGNSPIPFSPTSGKGMQLSNFHKVVADTPQSVKDEVAANLRELDRVNSLDELITWANRGMKHNRNSKNYKTAMTDLIAKIQELKK